MKYCVDCRSIFDDSDLKQVKINGSIILGCCPNCDGRDITEHKKISRQ